MLQGRQDIKWSHSAVAIHAIQRAQQQFNMLSLVLKSDQRAFSVTQLTDDTRMKYWGSHSGAAVMGLAGSLHTRSRINSPARRSHALQSALERYNYAPRKVTELRAQSEAWGFAWQY